MSEKVTQSEVTAIREALRQVMDPEIGVSVVEMGMIREIQPTDEGVEIKMVLTSPFCPLSGLITSQVKSAAEAVVDQPVTVTLSDEPWNPAMMEQSDAG
jgi:metal-sulfur cluster biosynthetic enzyme